MNPFFKPEYIKTDLFSTLRDEVAWVNRASPRDECFMAGPGAPTSYSYGNNNERREELHTYHGVDMHPAVLELMLQLNRDFGTEYNVAVLNYYKDERQHLGWHADDSPEQDLSHPIAVVAFGATREIWVKKRGEKGAVPAANRYTMTPGSLFVMPGGFQDENLHRIPKHPEPCGGRISITYRKLDR
jgi:alkylated DNA repair dioxygenase AlkB